MTPKPGSHPAIASLAIGNDKGHLVTKIERKQRQSRHKGRLSKKTKVCRELVREIAGFAPYERRVMELLRIRDKKALKFLKRRIGQHGRAKRKRDDIQNVLVNLRKQQHK